jgi:hemophore-related protein
MFMLASSKNFVVAGVSAGVLAGGVAVAATMGVGVASADPDLGPIINTTCSYAQVTAALNVVAPDMAAKVAGNPMISSRLQSFLAAPVDQRQQMANQAMARGGGGGQAQQILGTLTQVANVCNSY